MPITRTPIVDDSGQGTDGTVIDNAWKQQFYDQIDAAVPVTSLWTAVPYAGVNFSASGGWTVQAGDQVTYRYARMGGTIWLSIFLQDTALGGSSTDLNINLPAGINSGGFIQQIPFFYWQTGTPAGTTLAGLANLAANNSYLQCRRDVFGTPWAAGAIYLGIQSPVAIAGG